MATLYVCSGSNGLYRSTDGGSSWQRLAPSQPVLPQSPQGVAIDPQNSATLYVGGSGGVAKSTDSGATWVVINNGLPTSTSGSMFVQALVVDSQDTSVLYASVQGAGLFKTVNSGAIWTQPTTDVTDTGIDWTEWIAIDPQSSNILFAATNRGVARSTDGGRTWAKEHSIVTGGTAVVLVDSVSPLYVYALEPGGVFRSTDGGVTWAPASNGLPNGLTTLAKVPRSPTVLYVSSSGGGLYRSSDCGTTWSAVGFGLDTWNIGCILPHATNTQTIYAGTSNGVYKSTNSGLTWELSTQGIRTLAISCIAVDPVTPANVYIGTSINKTFQMPENLPPDPFHGMGAGAFRSTNGGLTWTRSRIGFSDCVAGLAIDPKSPSTIYVAMGSRGGVCRSADGGITWPTRGTGLDHGATCIVVDPVRTSTIYAGTFNGGVYKSSDSGNVWTQMINGFPTTGPTTSTVWINALLIDPAHLQMSTPQLAGPEAVAASSNPYLAAPVGRM